MEFFVATLKPVWLYDVAGWWAGLVMEIFYRAS